MIRIATQSIHKDDGFTLMEMLIALTILAVGLLAIATMQMRSLQISSYAGDMTAGTTVAQDKLEDLLTMKYSDLVAGNVNETSGPFNISTTIAANTPVTNTMTITVVVTWNERGVTKTSRLVGVKAAM